MLPWRWLSAPGGELRGAFSPAAASIGLINSIGNLGGFVGPYAVGYFQTTTGSAGTGMSALVVSLLLAGLLVLRLQSSPPALPAREAAGVRTPAVE